jgi:xanthine dehydrogenase small subunit
MPTFLLNQTEIRTDAPAGSSLVDFLRNHQHLYGTKIGCREGDCGACTVLVGERAGGRMRYQTMASCLTPLGNVAGRHVVTIEGLNQEKLSFIQEAFVEMNATQCGFCTPGFILSVYGFCLGGGPLTSSGALAAVAGNLCRCTGYASIKRALEAIVVRVQPMDPDDPLPWLVEQQFLPEYFRAVPERLAALPARAGASQGYPIAGGTDLLIQDFEGANDADPVRLLWGSEPRGRITVAEGRCTIGSACTITRIKESAQLRELIPGLDGYLDLMASHPIRNMGTLGGNLANASPLGDLTVIFMALDADLRLSGPDGERVVRLKDFYTGYKKTRLAPAEIIETVAFDLPSAGSRFSFEKTSKRVHLDMATVNSAMRVVLDRGVIRQASFAVGSLGPSVMNLEATCAFLKGRPIDNDTFREANRIAQGEIAPVSRHPGDGDYKRALLRQHLMIHLLKFAPGSVSLEALR